MKEVKPNGTKIIVLGGLGEVGKNMYCVMHKDQIIIIDAGVSFPESELLGIDYVLPDFTFLKENEDKIKALLITHGHEDHSRNLCTKSCQRINFCKARRP